MSNTFKDLPYRVKMMREGILDHDHRNGVCEVQNPLVRSYHRAHNPEAECALCDNWAAPCSYRMPADCRDWYRCCSGCNWCDSSLRYDRKHGSRHKSKQELKALRGAVAEDYEDYYDSFTR